MAKFRALVNAFTGGEVSPRVQVRSDVQKYSQCCKLLQNMIAHPLGGASRRPGTQHVATLNFVGSPGLIPFKYSEDETYAIVIPYSSSSPGGTTQDILAIRLGADNAVTATDTSVQSPYDDLDVPTIQYAQSADVLYLVHKDYKPLRFTRTGLDTFTLEEFDYGLTGQTLVNAYPYRDANTSAITLDPSNTSGDVTIAASAAFFDEDHVGAIFRFKGGGGATWGAYKITGFTSSTSVSATTLVSPDSHAASTSWQESAWSTYRGWPRTVCFYEDRLVYGGNTAQPDTLWHSQTANYGVMALTDPTATPSGINPFKVTFLSQQLNEIMWLSPGKKLFVGTSGDEYLVSVADQGASYGLDNYRTVNETSYGSSYNPAIRVGNTVLFLEKGQITLREYAFDYNQDSYIASNLSLQADHMIENSYVSFWSQQNVIVQTAWDADRNVLWVVTRDGRLYGVTRERAADVVAWHRHPIGGTGVRVISVITLPNKTYKKDDVFLCLARTVNSGTVLTIERIGQNFTAADTDDATYGYCDKTLPYAPIFCDGAVRVAASPATDTFSGFDHLEGETVVGLADGFYFTATVVSGDIVLPFTAKYVIAGLPYTPILQPVNPEAGSQIGSAQGATKRVHRAWIKLFDTIRVRIGRDATHLETPIFRENSVGENLPTPLFTGTKKVDFPGEYSSDLSVYITSDQPFPLNVAAVVVEGITYD